MNTAQGRFFLKHVKNIFIFNSEFYPIYEYELNNEQRKRQGIYFKIKYFIGENKLKIKKNLLKCTMEYFKKVLEDKKEFCINLEKVEKNGYFVFDKFVTKKFRNAINGISIC